MKWRNNPPVPLPAVCLATSALLFYRQPPLLPVGADELHLTPSGRFTEEPARETQPRLSIRTDKRNVYFKKLFACLKPQWHDGRLLWLLKANVGLWVKKQKIFQHSSSSNLRSNWPGRNFTDTSTTDTSVLNRQTSAAFPLCLFSRKRKVTVWRGAI